MNASLHLILHIGDWLDLFAHYVLLSLLSVGGVISTVPEMHRYLVIQQLWLTESQFNTSIAIAQASPGPNVLFAALMGWNIGLNAGSVPSALLGAGLTMLGILLPSSTLTFIASRWGHRNRELLAVRAFKQGMAPLVIALMFSAGWVLISAHNELGKDWPLWLVFAATALIICRTRIHLLWLLAAGALLGYFGWV